MSGTTDKIMANLRLFDPLTLDCCPSITAATAPLSVAAERVEVLGEEVEDEPVQVVETVPLKVPYRVPLKVPYRVPLPVEMEVDVEEVLEVGLKVVSLNVGKLVGSPVPS